MYKNFKITEEEKKEILESHKSHGYNTQINEQAQEFDEGGKMSANRRFDSVITLMYSHLSDMMYCPPMMNHRANFLKVLIDRFVPQDAAITREQVDQLWDDVVNGDYSGKAIQGEYTGDDDDDDDDIPM